MKIKIYYLLLPENLMLLIQKTKKKLAKYQKIMIIMVQKEQKMYRAKPLSRKKIRTRAKIVRKVLDVSDRDAFPVMDFLEKYLPLMRV